MKKRKLVKGLGIGAAFTGMLFGAGCHPQCVYGPPPEKDPGNTTAPAQTVEAETFEAQSMPTETVYGPPQDMTDFDPSEMDVEDVYGPPVEDFDPETMEEAPLYGPPPEETVAE